MTALPHAPRPSLPSAPSTLLTRFLRTAALSGTVGASLGLGVAGLVHYSKLEAFVRSNALGAGDRHIALAWIVGGALVAVVAVGAFWNAQRANLVERAVRLVSPLAVVGLVPYLSNHRFWVGNELNHLVLVLSAAMALRVLLEGALAAGGAAMFGAFEGLSICDAARGRRAPLLCVVSLAAAYATYFSVMTLRMHYNFCTSAFDLGIENNLVWNAVHGEALFRSTPLGGSMRHGGFHQTYFAYVVGLIYRFFPRAETLLIFQSTLIGASVIPLFLFARRRVGQGIALFLVTLYPFYAPLHGANLYDFHYQPLGMFFLLLLAYLVESNRNWLVFPVVLLTLSIREDMGAMTAALGAFFAFSGRRPQLGLVLAAVGGVYFVLLKLYIMPRFFLDGQSSFAFMYKDLLPAGEAGFGGVLKTAFGNPAYTLSTLLTREKLVYVMQLFVPLCLLPLRRTVALVLFGPAAIFTLLSTGYPALIMTTFQYTSYWTPMVFLACVWNLESFRGQIAPERQASAALGARVKIVAWLGGMAFAMLFTSLRFGVILQRETAQGAFDPVRLEITPEDVKNQEDFRALAAQIEANAPVAASEWLIPHVSNRRDAYAIRNGILDARYIIFWLHPTKVRSDERPVLREALRQGGAFGVVASRGMFVLAKRGHSSEKNQSVLVRL